MTDSSTPKMKKSVQFSNVSVREYPMILGDNPAVSGGPPVTIDWQHFSEETFSIDLHIASSLPRRFRCEMIMPDIYRRGILANAGCSCCEMTEAIDKTNVIKIERIKSFKALAGHETKENIKNKMKNIFARTTRVHNLVAFSNSVKLKSFTKQCARGA